MTDVVLKTLALYRSIVLSGEKESEQSKELYTTAMQMTDMNDQTREALAAYAHNAWCSWMTYLFSKCEQNDDGSVTIPPWAAKRWMRQAETKYVELPEPEKESDRDEADQILAIVSQTSPNLS